MIRLTLPLILLAGPALAAGKGDYGFFSLRNTDFVVLLGFLLFVGVLVYFKVPTLILGMLDKRADGIRGELDEAKRLREEAQTLLASYERKQREVQEQADRIVANARDEATAAAEKAKADVRASIDRRVKTAEDQIASARDAAVKEVRDRAIEIATAAAAEVVADRMGDAQRAALVDDAISAVDTKLH